MKLDSHSHQISKDTQVLVGVHTKAVHLWELTLPFNRGEFDKKWEALTKDTEGIIAVGECGLDRVHEGIASIEDQVYVLLKHFELAEKLNLPLIVHSVRTHSDILGILKNKKFQGKLMLHAFGGNERELHEYLKYDVYFTYGARIFKTDKMLKFTPIERLLLETGDQSEYCISDIYREAARILEMDEEKLEEILYQNFLRAFGQLDNVGAADFIKNLNQRKPLT